MWKYAEEHIEYVRSIADNRYNREIAEMFNEKFSMNKTATQISSMKKNHGIKSGDVRKRNRPENKLFTDEQEAFLKENIRMTSNSDLTKMVNEKFNLEMNTQQILTWKKNNGLTSGLTGRFEKGQKSWNKGMVGLQLGGEKGWFEKGHKPHNHKPVGTERVNGDDYVDIKIEEPNVWEAKHRLIWKKENGPIPKGHVVIFGDGNRRNFEINNLILVSKRILSILNGRNLIQNETDLTRTGIVVANIHSKIGDLKKDK